MGEGCVCFIYYLSLKDRWQCHYVNCARGLLQENNLESYPFIKALCQHFMGCILFRLCVLYFHNSLRVNNLGPVASVYGSPNGTW